VLQKYKHGSIKYKRYKCSCSVDTMRIRQSV